MSTPELQVGKREIELAGAPVGRPAWLFRLLVRSVQIAFWFGVALLRLPVLRLSRGSWPAALGVATASLFERLGATFIKVGQIISTRPDIFPARFIAPFIALQDRVPPFPFEEVRRAIEEDFGRPLADVFVEFDPEPVASASVAQVHRALLHEDELPPTFPSRVVAVKVRRPGIVRRAYLDEAILDIGARILSLVPTFSLISPREAVGQFCEAVNKQLDFRLEAENNRCFRKNFELDPHVVLPALVDQLCSDRVLTMEFIEGVKDDRIRAVGDDPRFIARKGIEVVAKMVFHHGLIHADFHPGNILFLAGNRVALIDVGLVAVLSPADRRRFAFLFYYVASGMGAEVARWFCEQSGGTQVSDYEAFEHEIGELVSRVHNRPIEEIQMTAYLAGVYAILRRYGVRFEATFTVANIAMTVMEGIGRRLDPRINLTRETRPYLEAALALSVADSVLEAVPALAPSAATPASIAGGRYRIRRLLGEGMRKRVYLARDTRLDRDVAVALLRTGDLDETGRGRINLEARAVARLGDHPRIVPVYDSGDEAGVPYVVSQYMGGGTLSGYLLRTTEHRLPIETVRRFADQVLQALEHAHRHGVVHRDVKPENIWLTEDGFAKLGDFGLARMVGRPDGSTEGMTVGTALYMSPEQARGRAVDQRSDLYSFGATLYELLTGRPPFEGESVFEVIAGHISGNPEVPSRRNPRIPALLDTLVLRLLSKAPENRFESAAAVRQALRDLGAAELASAAAADDGGAPASTGVFVGREQEIARLRKGLEEALAGHGRLFVLVGEPGIGKTRAAELLSSYASRRGSAVLSGRSFEGEGAPAFWPWVQILRGCLEGKDPARLESELGPGAAYVAQIIPEIRALLPDLPALPAIEGEEARFRLFDAVSTFLKSAATAQPLFLLLDDLHWADKPSLLLLHFVTRELAGARILIVATYRDVDVQHGHPLAEVLPSLRRERAFERILLRGLAENEVRALVTALGGAEAPEPFVRAIHRETEGNPFFIEETLRHLVEEGVVSREGGRWTSRLSPDEVGLPEGVREVIGRRLARLSADCRRMLATAAVLGRDFAPLVLEQIAGLERSRLDELLEEAAAARIIEEEARGPRRRFSHALIRETLYAELGMPERVRLHQKIAEALHALYAADREEHLAELAVHFFEALPGGDVDRAIEFAARAAERADEQLAYEEAASFYERALRALDLMAEPDEARRGDLLLALGSARWKSGELGKSKETLREAAELAERTGRAELLAQVALLYAGEELQVVYAAADQDMIPFLERALAALPAEGSALRAMVTARLAGALTLITGQDRARTLFEEALSMASQVGDARALATVSFNVLLARWGSESFAQLRERCAAAIRLFTELGDERSLQLSLLFDAVLTAEAGEVESAAAKFSNAERFAAAEDRNAGLRWFASYLCTGWALRAATPAEAEGLVQRTFGRIGGGGGENQGALAPEHLMYLTQKTWVLWQEGRVEESAAILKQAVIARASEMVHIPKVAAVFMASQLGRKTEAREALESMSKDFSELREDTFRLPALVLFAQVVDFLGDTRRAQILHDLLLSYGDRIVSIAGSYYIGSVSSALGVLTKTLSRYEDAVQHFEAALQIQRGMPMMLARTRYEYATLLALRASPGDREQALALLGRAIEGAQTFGMKKVAMDALALKLELEGVAEESVHGSIDAVTASIDARRPDFRRHAAPDGTVTLMFSDMEGFSAMTERLGDRRALEIVQAHNAIIRQQLRLHEGFEVDSQGDGFLIAFSSAQRGLECAIGAQQAFAAYNEAHPEEPIRVRIGLHTGEAIKEGDKFYGKTVILAARIAGRARGGEILASSLVRQLTEGRSEIAFGRVRELELKGLAGRHPVSAVAWNGEPEEPGAAEEAATPISATCVFQRSGDFWTLRYEGKSLSMRDAKGLHYIACLLHHPGQEFHALDLVREASPLATGGAGEGVAARGGDAGEVLDPQAKAAYKARLDDLRSELEEARERNDIERAATLEEEIDFITQELSAAYGLGGRARKGADSAERARKAVQSRVSDSISRIRKEHPALALHLTQSIRLGTFCAYVGGSALEWHL